MAPGRIECLIGVAHASITRTFVGPLRVSEIFPGEDLVGHIRQLPKGTKVGLETFDHKEEDRLGYEVEGVEFEAGGSGYFAWLKDFCEGQDLKVVNLDSFALLRQCTETELRLGEWVNRLNIYREALAAGQKELPLEGLMPRDRALWKKIGAMRDVRDLMFLVGRERYMLDILAQDTPHTAIIGNGHAGFFMANRPLLAHYGLSVARFANEDLEDPNRPSGVRNRRVLYWNAVPQGHSKRRSELLSIYNRLHPDETSV